MHCVLKSLLLLGSATLISCGDDEGSATTNPDSGTSEQDSGTENESSSSSSSSSRSSSSATATTETMTERTGPEGCYLQDNHACDCSIKSKAECDSVGLWTTGCASCTAKPEDGGADAHATADGSANDGSTGVDAAAVYDSAVSTEAPPSGAGCYDPGSHVCDCNADEDACTDDDLIWSDECGCSLADGATTNSSDQSSDPATSETTSDGGTNGDSGSNTDAAVTPDSGEMADAAQ